MDVFRTVCFPSRENISSNVSNKHFWATWPIQAQCLPIILFKDNLLDSRFVILTHNLILDSYILSETKTQEQERNQTKMGLFIWMWR